MTVLKGGSRAFLELLERPGGSGRLLRGETGVDQRPGVVVLVERERQQAPDPLGLLTEGREAAVGRGKAAHPDHAGETGREPAFPSRLQRLNRRCAPRSTPARSSRR